MRTLARLQLCDPPEGAARWHHLFLKAHKCNRAILNAGVTGRVCGRSPAALVHDPAYPTMNLYRCGQHVKLVHRPANHQCQVQGCTERATGRVIVQEGYHSSYEYLNGGMRGPLHETVLCRRHEVVSESRVRVHPETKAVTCRE